METALIPDPRYEVAAAMPYCCVVRALTDSALVHFSAFLYAISLPFGMSTTVIINERNE